MFCGQDLTFDFEFRLFYRIKELFLDFATFLHINEYIYDDKKRHKQSWSPWFDLGLQIINTGNFKRFLIPVAATDDFMLSLFGPSATLLLIFDHYGPIRATFKSTVAATRIEKKNRIQKSPVLVTSH